MNETERALVNDHLDLVDIVLAKHITPRPDLPGMERDDLYQIGCMALCKAAARYDGQRPFRPFAYSVIRNALLDHCRAQCRHTAPLSLDGAGDEEDGSLLECLGEQPDLDRRLQQAALRQALQHAKQRSSGVTLKGIEALELQAVGYTSKEIAALYGVRSNVVAAWVSRAAQKLRKDPQVVGALRST